jgi:transposase-like protein
MKPKKTAKDYTAKERFNIVMEGQESTVSDTCQRYGISRDTYYQWKRAVDEAALEALTPGNAGRKPKDYVKDIDHAKGRIKELEGEVHKLQDTIKQQEKTIAMAEVRVMATNFYLERTPDEVKKKLGLPDKIE